MKLSAEEASLLAQYLVARNAEAWEVDWEDFPNLDEDSVGMLNDAIYAHGEAMSRHVDQLEHMMGVDVRYLFERATR